MTVASVPEHLLPVDVKTLETFPYFRCVARCSILAMYNYNQLNLSVNRLLKKEDTKTDKHNMKDGVKFKLS